MPRDVVMRSIYAGPLGTCRPNHVLRTTPAEAKALIDAGYAVPFSKKAIVVNETAVETTSENLGEVESRSL